MRLIGIDAPEPRPGAKLRRDAAESGHDAQTIQALGRLASEHAGRLASGRPVELEYDQSNAATGYLDRYRRTLAYVHVLDDAGRRLFMVNQRMIRDDFAFAYTRYPFLYALSRTPAGGAFGGTGVSGMSRRALAAQRTFYPLPRKVTFSLTWKEIRTPSPAASNTCSDTSMGKGLIGRACLPALFSRELHPSFTVEGIKCGRVSRVHVPGGRRNG